jgi:hypothetical protein
MTKISYVGRVGLPDKRSYEGQHLAWYGEEQTAGLQPPMIDYLQTSSGEMWAQLLKAQAQMYALSYPSLKVNFEGTVVNPYVQAGRIIDDSIAKGLHRYFDPTKIDRLAALSPAFASVASALRQAANMAAPASDLLMLKGRDSLLRGTDPDKQIGEIVTLDNCTRWERDNFADIGRGGARSMYSTELGRNAVFVPRGTDELCIHKMEYRDEFNKSLPDSSHQLIYNWVTDGFLREGVKGSLDSVAIAKIVNKASRQTGGIEVFANVSKIEQNLIAEWVKTGVMGANQRKGLAPKTPEELLVIFRDTPEGWDINVEKGREENDFKINPIPFLIQIAILVVGSIIAIGGLIQILQGKEPTAFRYVTELFSKVLSPSPSDFNIPNVTLPTGGTGSGGTCPTGFTKNAAGLCVPIVTTPSKTGLSTNTMLAIGGAVVVAGGIYLATKDDTKK